MTTGKTIALTRQAFVGNNVSAFNWLSRLVINFLRRSKYLLISWLQSPSAVIFSKVTQSCWLFATPWTVAYQDSPWDFPGKSTRVGCHFLLQGIFPTQESNPGLPHCRQAFYCLSQILEPLRIVCHCFHCLPIYLPWSNGTRCHDLSFLNVEL